MNFLKTVFLMAMVILVFAEEDSKTIRSKRQQIAFYTRRGGRPPPYAVQMEPIVQYSQRDPLYNPSASSKSDEHTYHDDAALYNHYSNEPEPIIEIIIKESNETLPTPVPPPAVPQPRPTKEPIQVFYVKYEKKKVYGDTKPRVVYDPPIPALNPVEEHEVVRTDETDERQDEQSEPVIYATEATPKEPSTTLRTIIRPESEVYHSGSSGIRVTFGTDQIPSNNHNKRSDSTGPSSIAPPAQVSSATPLPPPGSPKRQHGPYHPLQPIHPRVTPAFPQQRIVNSFPPQQQHLPPNYPGSHQQFQPPLNGPRPQQRPAITIQGLPELQQRLPFQNLGTPHRISINHPQQPGFPHSLSVSHQSVHIQNQPPSLLSAGNFNADLQQHRPFQQQQPHQSHQLQQPHQPQQPPHQPQQPPHQPQQPQQPQHAQQQQQQQQQQIQPYKQQELEKQRYHQEQRRQQELRYREQHRQQEQQQQLEQQRQQEHQRKLEQQRVIEQQRQQDQQRQQERQRQDEQQRIQEQQRFHLEQQRRNQEQENKLLQEQKYRQQLKFGQPQSINNQQSQQSSQPTKPGGEIFKAVPKLEQHYAIRENPLHPGPFPPNPQIQTVQYSEVGPTLYPQQASSSPDDVQQQQQYILRNPPTNVPSIATSQQQQQQQQLQAHNSVIKYPTYQNEQHSFFAQNLPTPHQQRLQTSSQQSSRGRPVFHDIANDKIYATPVSNSNDLGPSSTPRTVFQSAISSIAFPTTTTTTTPVPTTASPTTLAPKNEARIKENIANLPDEVPDDIRQQLLSSGILGNADIQILDYDKIGGIPIENLPPEALENFYGAGGAAATSASEPVPSIAKRPKNVPGSSGTYHNTKKKSTFTKVEHATLRPGGVEMKVVHFDPNTAQGQAIADQHIRDDATHLKPVAIGTRNNEQQQQQQYNRYLPLKVSGASFPIPDVPELEGRKISSVVVLAPVDYSGFRDISNDERRGNNDDDDDDESDDTRQSRMLVGAQPVKFLAGDTLKQLVKKPNAENYKKWLDQESRTEPQRQSVVLLVTTLEDDSHGDKEIFMYDVSSQLVSKLSGDLSSAFVNAAESNSDSSDNIDDSTFATY